MKDLKKLGLEKDETGDRISGRLSISRADTNDY